MAHAVLQADAVPLLGQSLDALPELGLIRIQHRGGHGVKPVGDHLLLGPVAQNLERGPVHTDDPGTVQGVAHHAAVHGGKEGLQLLVLPHDLRLIRALLGYVNGDAYRPHHAAVQIVQGRFIGGQQPGTLPRHHRLLRYEGLPALHDLPLRLNTGGVVLLHIPDVGVALSLHLLLGLVDRAAEAVVHFLVYPVLCLIPDQVGDTVDGGLQIVAGLPEVLGLLALLLPAEEMEPQLLLRQGRGPYVLELGQGQVGGLLLAAQYDQLRLFPLVPQQLCHGLLRVHALQSGQNQVCLRRQSLVRRTALQKRVAEVLQRLHGLQSFK